VTTRPLSAQAREDTTGSNRHAQEKGWNFRGLGGNHTVALVRHDDGRTDRWPNKVATGRRFVPRRPKRGPGIPNVQKPRHRRAATRDWFIGRAARRADGQDGINGIAPDRRRNRRRHTDDDHDPRRRNLQRTRDRKHERALVLKRVANRRVESQRRSAFWRGHISPMRMSREEPASWLFEVPADYRVVDDPGPSR
jgi:hypothetical protein